MPQRLRKAERLLADLTLRRQGKARLTDRAQVEEAIEAVLKQCRAQGVLQVQIQEEVREHPVRASRGRLSPARREWEFQLAVSREETAIARAMSQLGWRVYATNHPTGHLGVEQAVEAYRDEHLVEGHFSRLKGHPLSLVPLYVQRDDHRVGLLRLLTIALRVLTVLEGVVRKSLHAQQEELTGLFAGNPKRRTAQPTAERLLETLRDITLTIGSAPGFAQRHVTPLSALQQQIFARCGFSAPVYGRFADDS